MYSIGSSNLRRILRITNLPHAANDTNFRALDLIITGRVQAVGFRPYIWRLASQFELTGHVLNQPGSVLVHVEGTAESCERFVETIPQSPPPAAIIKEITVKPSECLHSDGFLIEKSRNTTEPITDISPDIALCDDCRRELNQQGRRAGYPLINCTNCGPRFTLIHDFPYDRSNTSMKLFSMCPECLHEFSDPSDRRFHAQPTSCFACGPVYTGWHQGQAESDFSQVLYQTAARLDQGHVVAMKGLGGYNLACNAYDKEAVNWIRKYKTREHKPFAVMFRNLETLHRHAWVDEKETAMLTSWRRPIVVLHQKTDSTIDQLVNPGLSTLGCFLPYLPLQELLFRAIRTDALVLTSANTTDTPIMYTEKEALVQLNNVPGGLLVNDREILRRCDDSVVKVVAGNPQIQRRARGYAPEPVELGFEAEGILATGAELSNCFCIGKSNQAVLSQHIGDLKNLETHAFFSENIEEFARMYRFNATRVACDLHPDYLSTRYARSLGLPVIAVQHHHAHVASVMAEHGIDEEVVGLAWDGTGLGTDGHIWGSEALLADYRSYRRMSHLAYLPLPGGDKAVSEPWRIAFALLWQTYGNDWNQLKLPFVEIPDPSTRRNLIVALEQKINTPLSCGTGRLFDGIAALTGVCSLSRYHAEAPARLEDIAEADVTESYPFTPGSVIDFRPLIRAVVEDMIEAVPVSVISGKFHQTMAEIAVSQVLHASSGNRKYKVVLSGGSFQNGILTEKILFLLEKEGYKVWLPMRVPANDGGLALGQLAVAAHQK